ncbi:hypothetical protein BJX61DRAFT_538998 [Aspergillus egyptiacus]|nr:hypothetical protein BJX61DRAFT_538998 [Aspergillus egyptiacus]
MASAATRVPLTQRNLAIHEQLLKSEQHATEAVSAWVERVIQEERTHLFCAQKSTSMTEVHLHVCDTNIERDMNLLDQGIQLSSTVASTDLESTKLFKQQRPFMFLHSPLDRFLTPGSSDPSYFSRPALAQMGIRYGSMEGSKERSEIALGHVRAVQDRAAQDGNSSSK